MMARKTQRIDAPDLIDSFEYEGEHVNVEWFDVSRQEDIPDLPWEQVYAIGSLEGKVPIVLYEDARSNLPGGHTEGGETVEETLRRELIEEMNCRVLSWRPIGYQKLTSALDDGPVYQLRVYARLERIGEFTGDPGGSVIGFKLIGIDDLNSEINYGKAGDRIVSIVKSFTAS